MIIFDQNDKKLVNIAGKFQKRLKHDGDVHLIIDESMGEFDCTIEDGVVITAGSHAQLMYACGRYLRDKNVRGSFHSHKEISGMYFAAHFNNYLDAAPMEELFEYLDDLAFWGMNLFRIWLDLHHFKSMQDPECQRKLKRHKAMIRHASEMGMKTLLGILSNETFDESPEDLRADWTCGHDGYIYPLNDHYHLEICPSKPGGLEKILEYRREFLEEFKDVTPDFFSFGAYDPGGCSCPKCAPWGSNGYIRCIEALIPLIKEYYPNARFVMGMWQFGTFTGDDREFTGLEEVFKSGRLSEIEYLISEPQYARYPFEQGMSRPLIGFPEISMYGANPWGGYGVNPLPKLLGNLWKENGSKLVGGWPYSEGLYEDINKVIMLRLYRDNQSPEDSIKEYLTYEFGFEGEELSKVYDAIIAMEETLRRKQDINNDPHRYVIENPEKIEYIEGIIKEADASLPEEIRTSKRWRLVYLRAVIDAELKKNNFTRNETLLGYYNEITDMCYLHNAGKHVKPDIGDTIHIKRKLTDEELERIEKGFDIDRLDD